MKKAHWGQPISPDLPYRLSSLLHELGHTFDLADTYAAAERGESFVSTGNLSNTRGKHAYSVMSSVYCKGGDICDDDKKAMQWLYRYHYEGLDPTNCPPDYVYDELPEGDRQIGGCVPRQPLIFEARQGHISLVQRMVKENKNLLINEQDRDGNTALHHLSTYLNVHGRDTLAKTLQMFFDYPGPGIDINIKNNAQSGGNTALHLAVVLNNHTMVRVLLAVTGVELNARNTLGMTPLHYAAKRGDVESAKLLLAHSNINPNLRTEAGLTALQIAQRRDDINAVLAAWAAETEPDFVPSPSELQQRRAEIAALLRAHPRIILPAASDINGDGIVNILDLVKIANVFGHPFDGPEDVNGDGIVNILDLVWVSGAFGQAAD